MRWSHSKGFAYFSFLSSVCRRFLFLGLFFVIVVGKIFLGDGFLCMRLEGVVISIAENELARLLISVTRISSVMEYERRESLGYIMYWEKRIFALYIIFVAFNTPLLQSEDNLSI